MIPDPTWTSNREAALGIIDLYQQALAIFREMGDRWQEAEILAELVPQQAVFARSPSPARADRLAARHADPTGRGGPCSPLSFAAGAVTSMHIPRSLWTLEFPRSRE